VENLESSNRRKLKGSQKISRMSDVIGFTAGRLTSSTFDDFRDSECPKSCRENAKALRTVFGVLKPKVVRKESFCGISRMAASLR